MPNLTSDLSPEERAERVAQIFAKGALRVLEQERAASSEPGGKPTAPK